MIGVHRDNMCRSDNKRSHPCVLPIILHSKTSFEGNASSQCQERSHQSKETRSFLSVGEYGLWIMFPTVRLETWPLDSIEIFCSFSFWFVNADLLIQDTNCLSIPAEWKCCITHFRVMILNDAFMRFLRLWKKKSRKTSKWSKLKSDIWEKSNITKKCIEVLFSGSEMKCTCGPQNAFLLNKLWLILLALRERQLVPSPRWLSSYGPPWNTYINLNVLGGEWKWDEKVWINRETEGESCQDSWPTNWSTCPMCQQGVSTKWKCYRKRIFFKA